MKSDAISRKKGSDRNKSNNNNHIHTHTLEIESNAKDVHNQGLNVPFVPCNDIYRKCALLFQINRANKFYVRSFVFMERSGATKKPFQKFGSI